MTDRARRALLGLAVGDALGTTLEFSAHDMAAADWLQATHRTTPGNEAEVPRVA